MESMTKKIKIALVKMDMNQNEFCTKTNRDDGNFSKQLKRDNYKISELESIAEDLGYSLEINLIDKITGEKI